MFILVLQKQMLHEMLGSSLMHKAFDMESHRDRKSTRLNSSHSGESRMPSSA